MGKKKWEHQVDRTPAELLDDLCTQLKFLWDACKQYDAGGYTVFRSPSNSGCCSTRRRSRNPC